MEQRTKWNELKHQLETVCPELELREQEPMSRHTSFRIGGPAALMVLPKNIAQAELALQTAAKLGIEPFFLGNGSNLLVPDCGVERFLLKTSGLQTYQVEGTTLTAEAGLSLARLAGVAKMHSLTGLEFANGIPGSLGGAVTMNAGAYGGEMAQVVRSVTCLTQEGKREIHREVAFGYRHSAFSDGSRLIVAAELALKAGSQEEIGRQMERLSTQRQEKQPLEYPSAGSMFKRPEGYFAAALIDQCGLRGLRVGDAQVSEKHAGFVVNRGGATCTDVLELVEQVKAQVWKQTGVELEMEVKILR